jgi:hypothetical protein
MSKGIAVQFKQKFGGIHTLELQKKTVGQVAFLKLETRFVFCLITKRSSRLDRPTIHNLRLCLQELKTLCKRHDIKRLSMPKIGSGNDKLDWKEVKFALEDAFGDTDMTIKVYVMSPWEGNLRSRESRDTMRNKGLLPKGRVPEKFPRRRAEGAEDRVGRIPDGDSPRRAFPSSNRYHGAEAQNFPRNFKSTELNVQETPEKKSFDETVPKQQLSPVPKTSSRLLSIALADTFSQDDKKPDEKPKSASGSFVRKSFKAPSDARSRR